MSAGEGKEPLSGRERLRRLLPWPIRRILQLLAAAVIVEYLVLPQVAGARKSLHLLLGVDRGWLFAGLAGEVLSLAAYTLATRAVLPRRGHRPGLGRLARIDLATVALSHAVPGGSAAGAGLGYRLLTEAGVAGSDAGFAKVTQGLGSTLVLQVLLGAALAASIPLHGLSPFYGTVAVIALALLTLTGLLVLLLTRGEEHAARFLAAAADRAPWTRQESGEQIVRRLAGRLREMGNDRRLLATASSWALANWLFDAAALWCCVRAFGHTLGFDGLMVPFGLAATLALVPITPGGLGIVEGVLVPSLVGFGTPRGIAILGVITWRLLNFWLPIPAGAATYLSLLPTRPR